MARVGRLAELAAFGIALLSSGGVCSSQSLTIGELPPSSDYSFAQNSQNGLVSVLDLGNRARFDGFLQNATFRWSNAPCQAAVGIGVYRASELFRGHIRLDLIAERGPFDFTSPTETVTFPAPVPVQAGDRIAIRNLTPCGAPTGLSASSSAALVLDGSGFPPEYAPLDQPFSSLPIQVAVKGTGVVNTSVIPVVISLAGQDSSFFRTLLQLYNGGQLREQAGSSFAETHKCFGMTPSFSPTHTITLEVKSGVVFVYGVTADNRTNDTSFQLAQRVGSD